MRRVCDGFTLAVVNSFEPYLTAAFFAACEHSDVTWGTIMRTRPFAVGLFMAALTISCIAPAPALHAQGLSSALVCSGVDSRTFNPGINQLLQSTTVADNITLACLPAGSNSQLTGGTESVPPVTISTSCLSLLQIGLPAQTVTYNWNDGSSSTVHYGLATESTNPAGFQVEQQIGTVTAGVGAGGTAVQTTVLPSYGFLQFNNACLSTQGERSLAGPIVVSISSLNL